MRAFQDFSADDDPAADTGAQRDHDHIFKALAASAPLLAQSRHIGIVPDKDPGPVQEAGQLLADVDHAPAQVDTAVDDTFPEDRTGHADTDPFHLVHSHTVGTELFPD